MFTCFVYASALAAPRPLTLDEVLSATATSDPQVRASVAAADAAAGTLLRANGLFDPIFGAHGIYTSAENSGFLNGFPYSGTSATSDFGVDLSAQTPVGTTLSLAAGLDRLSTNFTTDLGIGVTQTTTASWDAALNVYATQPLLRGVGLAATLEGIRVDKKRFDSAVLAARATTSTAQMLAATAYWEWVYAVAQAQIADEAAALATETARMADVWAVAGRVSTADHARFSTAAAQSKADAIVARAAVGPAADAVLVHIGGTPGEEVLPATPAPDVVPTPIDPLVVRDAVLAANPDLAQAEANVDVARFALTAARVNVLPQLDAVVGGGIGSLSPSAGLALRGLTGPAAFPYVTAGGVFSVPLGNRAGRGDRAAAAASVAGAEADRDAVRVSVAAEAMAASADLLAAAERAVLADSAASWTAETLSAEEALLVAGRGLPRDVLDARAAYARARADAVRARIDHAIALAKLRALRGE